MSIELITEYQVQTLPSLHDLAAYELAFKYVCSLEPDPRTSRLSRHLYDTDGKLLAHLDQVVRACECRQLAGLEEET